MAKNPEKVEGQPGMSSWADALKNVEPELGRRLAEPRDLGFKNVEMLDLPRYKRLSMPLATFLENPGKYFDELGSPEFFVFLQPKDGAPPIRERGLSRQESVRFIGDHAPSSKVEDFDIFITQNFEVAYGGNVIVNPDGQVVVEFREGNQGPISWGSETPQYIARKDPLSGSFEYSFDDERLRRLVQNVLRRAEVPGYYEFHIIEDGGVLVPRFIDYRDNPAYQLAKKAFGGE